jgi:hypothetical protein
VEYRAATEDIERKIQLTNDVVLPKAAASGKQIHSPQETRWFMEIDPDYTTTSSPWTTTIYVQAGSARERLLKATFVDHGNTFTAQWINEKLLFVQVWWGRIASSDLILDIEHGKFIYDELAHYGELGQPCQ